MADPATSPLADDSGMGAWRPIPEQREIIEAPASARLLIVAPPGTGKTAVACARVGHLVRESGVAASNVLIMSFTRTAVAEIRARIEGHVGPGISVSAMPITTVDSHAWALQFGFSEDQEVPTKWFARHYDVSIRRALELLKERSSDVIGFLARFEHVIVDEAQDLVGDRLELVSELIKCLPPTCGVTVFADFLQAIYDFNAGTVVADTLTSDSLRNMLGPEFTEKRLTHLHRFKNEKLAAVLTQVRELLELSTLPPAQARASVRALLQREEVAEPLTIRPWEIGETEGISGDDGLLILFRSRAEVLCASSSLCRRGIPHRIRMSGLPDCIHPWFARVFAGFVPSGMVLTKPEFFERAVARGIGPDAAEAAWHTLRRLARRRDGVDWRGLRVQLSRPRPPVEACYLDLGTSGPTIGTVHASKGREARRIYYCMPPETDDSLQELRVDYVALTRGSEMVRVGAAVAYRASDESDRVFRFEKRGQRGARTARIEVGRIGDLVDESALDGEAWELFQEYLWTDRLGIRPLRASKAKCGNAWQYVLAEAVDEGVGTHCGRLSSDLQRDIFSISRRLHSRRGKQWIPGKQLYDLYRVAVRTVVMAEDDHRLGALPLAVRETGYFLVPVVRGWSLAYFKIE